MKKTEGGIREKERWSEEGRDRGMMERTRGRKYGRWVMEGTKNEGVDEEGYRCRKRENRGGGRWGRKTRLG